MPDIRSTVTLAGRVAGSLPQSTRAAVQELDRLKVVQAANRQEAGRLRRALAETGREAGRDSEEYRNLSAALMNVQAQIDQTDAAMEDAALQAREGQGATSGFTASLGRLSAAAPHAAAAIGLVTGTAGIAFLAMSRLTGQAQDLQRAFASGLDTQAFAETSGFFLGILGDADRARAATLSAADAQQRLRESLAFDPRTLGGNQLRAISALGLSLEQAANLPPSALVEQLRGLLQTGDRDFLLGAARQTGIYSDEMIEAATATDAVYNAARRLSDGALVLDQDTIDRANRFRLAMSSAQQSIGDSATVLAAVFAPTMESIAENAAALAGHIETVANLVERYNIIPRTPTVAAGLGAPDGRPRDPDTPALPGTGGLAGLLGGLFARGAPDALRLLGESHLAGQGIVIANQYDIHDNNANAEEIADQVAARQGESISRYISPPGPLGR